MISLQRLAFVLVIGSACGSKEDAKPAPGPSKAEIEAADRAKLAADQAASVRAAREAFQMGTLHRLHRELSELDARVATTVDRVVDAKSEADRKSAAERLVQLQKEQRALMAEMSAALPRPPNGDPPSGNVDDRYKVVNDQILGAADSVAAAKSDAEREIAKATLAALEKELAELNALRRKDAEARLEKLRDEAAKRPPPRWPVPNDTRTPRVPSAQECKDNPLAKGC